MSDFKTRLLEEKAQLDEKGNKLAAFVDGDSFKGIDPIQQMLLKIQVCAMSTYRQCLDERIALLEAASVS